MGSTSCPTYFHIMIILNDIHIGFRRTGGTTPESQEALRSYLISSLCQFLVSHPNDALAIVGDLFDDFDVSARDWLKTYEIFCTHLITCPHLILVAGNHDWSPRATKVSGFEMLARVLEGQFPNKVQVIGIDEVGTYGDAHFVAHCSNQDLFEQRLNEVWEEAEPGQTVFVHANFDNNFAAQSDHSLNVSREVAKSFVSHGIRLVFAHEHQARSQFDGMLQVMGNQWPTSIADCLNNSDKWFHSLVSGKFEHSDGYTWAADMDYGYVEVDWRDIPVSGKFAAVRGGDLCVENPGFVRIVGKASSNEASDVINAIADLRKKADPTVFVIGNSVKVEGLIETEELPESFEAAKRFDVMDFLSQHLTGDEMKAVNELLGKSE